MFYGTDTEWDVLTSQSNPSLTKLELIVQLAIGLGMRCPSEPTLKLLCLWWMVCSHTAEVFCKLAYASILPTAFAFFQG